MREIDGQLMDENYSLEEALLTRSFIYKFMSFAYRYPDESIVNCLSELWVQAEITLSDFPDLFKLFELLGDEFDGRASGKLENEYIGLFGHTAQGNCPPFEIEYGEGDDGLQKPHELSDIAAFYRAAGLVHSPGSHEREDFISIELEFMNFLYFKQYSALEKGDMELVTICVDLQKKFLKDHLARWLPAFSNTILKHSENGFYGVLAKLTNQFVAMCCNELGIEPGSEGLRIRVSIENPDDCNNCSFKDK